MRREDKEPVMSIKIIRRVSEKALCQRYGRGTLRRSRHQPLAGGDVKSACREHLLEVTVPKAILMLHGWVEDPPQPIRIAVEVEIADRPIRVRVWSI